MKFAAPTRLPKALLRLQAFVLAFPFQLVAHEMPSSADIDGRVNKMMADAGARGMAIPVIDEGKISYIHAFGVRNAAGDPLKTDTIMYGASLTKTVVAYATLKMVDAGKIDLDAPIADYLDKPLPNYGP